MSAASALCSDYFFKHLGGVQRAVHDHHGSLRLLEFTLLQGLESSRTRLNAGCFAILWVADEPTVWMNYAMPTGPATAEDVRSLVAAFDSIGRMPRLEFFHDLYPSLRDTLAGAGFQTDLTAPIMTMSSSTWKRSKSLLRVTPAAPSDAPLLLTVMNSAFGVEEADTNDTRTVSALADGRYLGALGWDGDLPVAGGFAVGDNRVREIAGVATLASHRRQGYGASVINHLLDRFFEAGGEIAWLTPGDAGAQSLYTKLGFEPTGTQLIMSKSPSDR